MPEDVIARVQQQLDKTEWDEPKTLLDLNSSAVVALVLAEDTDDLNLRGMYLETAVETLQAAANSHPLCSAHLALIQCMIEDKNSAIQSAFSLLIKTSYLAYAATSLDCGIVYIPRDKSQHNCARSEMLSALLANENAYQQTLLLCADILRRSQLVFYNSGGLRFLQLALQYFPNSSFLHLSLGLSKIFNNQWEGLLNLHQAQLLNSSHSPIYQALVLAYRRLQDQEIASAWSQRAQEIAQTTDELAHLWEWTSLPSDSPFIYMPFGEETLLAAEANLKSIVTSILITEGDWFEDEMEFWHHHLKPGMTVIDVGANVGVYTFSAAQQVGSGGKVIAVEPFSGCVKCLQETCRINQFDWVKVYGAAASDRPGNLYLSIHSASELNEILSAEEASHRDNVEEVPCITLDDLSMQEKLDQVDFLKIDAEGHELNVLQGSEKLLNEYSPCIMYENISGNQASNTPVAEYLQQRGYELFRYQPYLQHLIPISSLNELNGSLNIIAIKRST